MLAIEDVWGDVGKLASALPPDGANPIGSRARSIFVNHVKGATPGHYSQLIGTGPSFRSIFFSGYVYDGEEGQITPLTGLDDDFWRRLSVAALCQQMHAVTSSLRPQLLINDINGAVGSLNGTLRGTSARWYAHIAAVTPGVIKDALAPFTRSAADLAAAKAEYIRGLTSEAWINMKRAQDASGKWSDRDWELFHHWIKLIDLGASDDEINSTITITVDKGLPVPDSLKAGHWRSWSQWMPLNLAGGDLSDANGPMLAEVCHVYPGSQWPSCMKEDNSFEFTANGQPGSVYRHAPGGSCFAPGAMVVLADGSLKAIETVAAGDEVRTPDGKRSVLLRAAPMRSDRPLFRFAGMDFAFTAGHPFLIHDGKPEGTGVYAAVDPERLAHGLPSLGQFGIRGLNGDAAPALVRHGEAGHTAFRPPAVEPVSADGTDTLYDLLLDLDEDGRSEYFVGDGNSQLLISSEVPRFLTAPSTTAVMLHVLNECAEEILAALRPVPDTGVHDLLAIGLDSVAHGLWPALGGKPTALREDHRPPIPLLAGNTPAALRSAVGGFSSQFTAEGSGGYDQRRGAFVDLFLSKFALQFHAAIRLGWRRFDLVPGKAADLLAVTIHGLELFDQADLPPVGDTELCLTLRCGPRGIVVALPVDAGASTARCHYSSDDVAYFGGWRQDDEPDSPMQLQVTLRRRSDGKEAGFAGMAYLPVPGDSGFLTLQAPVLTPDGRTVGSMSLDVRCLTDAVRTQEDEARRAWTAEREVEFGHSLAHHAAGHIADRFRWAILTFQSKAATAAARNAQLTEAAS